VIREHRPRVATLGSGAAAETVHALPLTGIEDNLLAVLLISSSRRELVELENSLGRNGAGCGGRHPHRHVDGGLGHRARHAPGAAAGRKRRPGGRRKLEHHGGGDVARRDRAIAQAFNRMTHELVDSASAWCRPSACRLERVGKAPGARVEESALPFANHRRKHAARPREPSAEFDEVFREGSRTLLAELANLKQIIARFSDFAKMPAPEMQP